MPEKEPNNKLIETKDLVFLWRMIVKNLGYLILIPLAAYAIGYVYTYRLNNVYGAKVQLLLKSNETYDYQDPIYKGLGAYGAYMDVQNQIRIIKSRDLIGEVIDKLNINTSYFFLGRIRRLEVFETLPFKSEVTVINPLIYEVPITVKILNENEYNISFEMEGKNVEFEGEFNKEISNEFFILNLERKYGFNESNLDVIMSTDYEIVFHSRDFLISRYQSKLEVENIEFTSVLDVSVTDEIALRAKSFLDTLTQVYIDYSKKVQLEVNQNTLDNIDKQIDTLNHFIQEKERELLSYKDDNAILNPEKEGDEYFRRYIEYLERKRILEQNKNSVKALREYLKNSEDDHVLPPYFYIEENDPYLQEAIPLIRSKQVSLEIRKNQEMEASQNIKNAKAEISMLKSDILDYLVNLDIAIKDELQVVDGYVEEYKYGIKRIPKSEQGILNIQRELDVNNKMYLFLLEKKTNTLIARAGIIPQVRVLEKAAIQGVVEPDKTKILRLFVMGGFVLSLFIAVMRKVFFEKIENVSELNDACSLNVIGGVPFQKNLGYSLMIDAAPKSQITESFRTIRTNLSYMGAKKNNKCRKILISSFYPGEGKTFCSTNLASLIGKGEKKVLIIDFDLHRPKIHKVFDVDNSIGLTNYLIHKNSFDEIILSDVTPNLDIIPAGPLSPNPSELILKNEVQELLHLAEEKYDFIIIDTPPFGLLNDTLELVKYIDTFIVILNTKYTRKRGLLHIEETLSKFDDISIGVILNGIKQKRLQYYYSKYTYKYTYGYNYGYGYGYGQNYGSEYYDHEGD